VLLDSCRVDVPEDRLAQASATAEEIGAIADQYPLVDGARATTPLGDGQLIARTWRAALSITGADGLPSIALAGNVLRPNTTLKLSLRIPPTADPEAVGAELTERLTADPPYGAHVAVRGLEVAPGWNAPPLAAWLADALESASTVAFGQPARLFGEGGSAHASPTPSS
jgi:acetylornithine deacetylase/succinyl-diaminopimelate desuccinylase-like protein